jgi:uncharacterized membrane protein
LKLVEPRSCNRSIYAFAIQNVLGCILGILYRELATLIVIDFFLVATELTLVAIALVHVGQQMGGLVSIDPYPVPTG